MGRGGGGGSRGGGGGGRRGGSGRSSSGGRSGGRSGGSSFSGSSSRHYSGGYHRHYGVSYSTMPVWGSLVCILVVAVLAAMFTLGPMLTLGNITRSTVTREPLPKGTVTETAYYTDELMWIDSVTVLESGMKHFYQKTGVQPYLYITDDLHASSIEDFSNALYDELFTDEAHVLLVFYERNNEYKDWVVTGVQAKQVVDQEAVDILLDYVDRYYYQSELSESEMFSKAFSDSADRMMKVTKSPVPIIIVAVIVLLIVIFAIKLVKVAAEKKKAEDERTERLLSTPISKIPETEQDDLLDKYKGE